MAKNLIRCTYINKEHEDCFARTHDGECRALDNCNFDDGVCHFYKKRKVNHDESRLASKSYYM